MRVDILTMFPDTFSCYFNESILKRAQKKKLLAIRVHDLRRWTADRHKTVDDRPYGGGPGMIMKVEPFYRAVAALKRKAKITAKRDPVRGSEKRKASVRVILTSAKGKQFTQADARRLAHYQRIIILCGRYEGVDERVADSIADEELSIGPYVLTGGELPAMVVVDALSRHIPGVLGHPESLEEKRHASC
ncbi:MAG: tRNA (guanosine(37)-N1)-methyltransferase TrmD, partial [Patescibacteria group bacterium]